VTIAGLLKAASAISTAWSLAAFAIAALVFLATHKQKAAARRTGTATVAAIVLLALVPIVGSFYKPSIYQLRTIVLDPLQVPVEDAKVWSSLGGEPKKISGGWQFDIPAASVAADRRLTVYATVAASFLVGQSEITLASDFHPNATIHLLHPETTIRGIVTDERGGAIEGAAVSVVGYGGEMIRTKADGGFELPAHAADGQQVELYAEKLGFAPGAAWYPAGAAPAELTLRRR
jgi:hypothetical protein